MVLRKIFLVDHQVNGRGQIFIAWSPSGTHFAVVGSNRRVAIVDRQGKVSSTFALPLSGPPVALDWDFEGEFLAVLQQGGSAVTIWHRTSGRIDNIESTMKDLCLLKWAKNAPVLAVGAAKGGVLLFNRDTMRKSPLIGKHGKKIIAMAWNSRNWLALASEDRTITVSDVEGNTIDTLPVKGDAGNLAFSDMKGEGKPAKGASGASEGTVSMSVLGKNLLLHNVQQKDHVVELAFNPKYGNIVTFQWYGDGYIVLGFSAGFVTVVSTHKSEIGTELSGFRAHRETLVDLTTNKNINKGATVGDNAVRIFDLDDYQLTEQKSEKYDLDAEFGALSTVSWSEDGQILLVATKNGNVYGFLTRIPMLSTSNGTLVMYLSSLRELQVRDVVSDTEVARVQVDMEPAFVGLGSAHAAVGMNNQVSYFSFDVRTPGKNAKGILAKTYPGIVECVKLSTMYAAVLLEGKALLHTYDDASAAQRAQKSFPEKESQGKALCIAMTDTFFMVGTQSGTFVLFSLVDHQVITEYSHICGLRAMSCNRVGTRVLWVDAANNAFVFHPSTEVLTPVENFAPGTENLLWDPDGSVAVGWDNATFVTYVFCPNTRFGPTCHGVMSRAKRTLVTTMRPYGFAPVLCFRGVVVCQMPTGSLAPIPLQTHQTVYFSNRGDTQCFENNLGLFRLNEAMAVATTLEQIQLVGEAALHTLNVDLAIRSFRQLNQPALVMFLERFRHATEKSLLLGHVSVIMRQYDQAQTFFVRSSNPMLALEMRRDLMHWDQALELAQRLAPDQVQLISKEYAQQLEFRGEFNAAQDMYQRGYVGLPPAPDDGAGAGSPAHQAYAQTVASLTAHNSICQSGVARCMMRLGNVRAGMQVCQAVNSQSLYLDCASILENMKQYDEAASLFEKAEQYERAAIIYVRDTKQLKAAARIIPKITSRNVLTMYAKAKETVEGAYADAEAAYAQAEDWDQVVRVKVEHLNDLQGAYVIVRRTKSSEAASIVAKVCRKRGEIVAAVEFLLVAKKTQEAFDVAVEHNAMSAFEAALLSQVPLKDGVAPPKNREDFVMIANYYEGKNNTALAGDFWHVAGDFSKALTKYLAVGTEEYVTKAIAVVGKAKSDSLTHRLLDYLMGEQDGDPKDPYYIFKLYMALKNYDKAMKTAVLIANKEQSVGSYRQAHKILLDTALVLQDKGVRLASDLRRTLMLVHSYLSVKHLLKPLEDHISAARLLLRVARNIQKFPKHVATILTTTVVECTKVDFKGSAYQYACQLLQAEDLQKDIPEKHRKKIETVVRKKGREELVDPPEPNTPCPFCNALVPETMLDCSSCKNSLPFCLVTGKHMTLDDWSQCPTCKFPALFTPFLKLLRVEPVCPMCSSQVNPLEVVKVANPDVKLFV